MFQKRYILGSSVEYFRPSGIGLRNRGLEVRILPGVLFCSFLRFTAGEIPWNGISADAHAIVLLTICGFFSALIANQLKQWVNCVGGVQLGKERANQP